MEKTRCPSCGALNAADAEWCNQCLNRFRAPEPPLPPSPPSPPEPLPALDAAAGLPDPLVEAPPVAVETPAAETPAAEKELGTPMDFTPPKEAVGAQHGAFSVKREGITWKCSVCDQENPLAAGVCGVCGTSFAAALRPPKEATEDKDPGTATLLSLFLPGAGHAYLGQWGQAWARGILNMWVAAIVLLAGVQGGVAGSGSIPILFGVVAFALWIVNAHDAYREASNEPGQVLLKGRMFLWVVLGILALLMILLFSAAMRAQN